MAAQFEAKLKKDYQKKNPFGASGRSLLEKDTIAASKEKSVPALRKALSQTKSPKTKNNKLA